MLVLFIQNYYIFIEVLNLLPDHHQFNIIFNAWEKLEIQHAVMDLELYIEINVSIHNMKCETSTFLCPIQHQ